MAQWARGESGAEDSFQTSTEQITGHTFHQPPESLNTAFQSKLAKTISTLFLVGVVILSGILVFAMAYDGFFIDWKRSRTGNELRRSYMLHVEMGDLPKPTSASNSLRCATTICRYSMPDSVKVVLESGDTHYYHGVKRTNLSETIPGLVYDFQFSWGRDAKGNVITNPPAP